MLNLNDYFIQETVITMKTNLYSTDDYCKYKKINGYIREEYLHREAPFLINDPNGYPTDQIFKYFQNTKIREEEVICWCLILKDFRKTNSAPM